MASIRVRRRRLGVGHRPHGLGDAFQGRVRGRDAPLYRSELEAVERRLAATDASLKRVAEAVRALSDPEASTADSDAGHF